MWIENEKANEPFIQHTIMELEDKYDDVPGVVVGAGYGFRDTVHEIYKKNKDIVMVATDKAFPACCRLMDLAEQYSPEYVVSLNTEVTPDVKPKEWYAPATKLNSLILPVTAHPSHVREWMDAGGGEIFWMVPANIDEDLSENFSQKYCPAMPRGANSGEFGFLMAFIMGCDPIGLVGMPYAFKSLPEVLEFQTPNNYEYHHFVQEGMHCFTTLPFMEQRTEFLELVAISQHPSVFNLSEGGILYDNRLVRRTDLTEFLEMCK